MSKTIKVDRDLETLANEALTEFRQREQFISRLKNLRDLYKKIHNQTNNNTPPLPTDLPMPSSRLNRNFVQGSKRTWKLKSGWGDGIKHFKSKKGKKYKKTKKLNKVKKVKKLKKF